MLVFWIIVGILMLSLLSNWIESRRLIWVQEMEFPKQESWFCWGYYNDREGNRIYSWVRIKLPSYAWESYDYGDRYCWQQRVLLWRSRGMNLIRLQGWHEYLIPVENL